MIGRGAVVINFSSIFYNYILCWFAPVMPRSYVKYNERAVPIQISCTFVCFSMIVLSNTVPMPRLIASIHLSIHISI